MLPAGKLTPASPANPEKLPNCEDNELSSVVGAKRLEEVYMFGKYKAYKTDINAAIDVNIEINSFLFQMILKSSARSISLSRLFELLFSFMLFC